MNLIERRLRTAYKEYVEFDDVQVLREAIRDIPPSEIANLYAETDDETLIKYFMGWFIENAGMLVGKIYPFTKRFVVIDILKYIVNKLNVMLEMIHDAARDTHEIKEKLEEYLEYGMDFIRDLANSEKDITDESTILHFINEIVKLKIKLNRDFDGDLYDILEISKIYADEFHNLNMLTPIEIVYEELDSTLFNIIYNDLVDEDKIASSVEEIVDMIDRVCDLIGENNIFEKGPKEHIENLASEFVHNSTLDELEDFLDHFKVNSSVAMDTLLINMWKNISETIDSKKELLTQLSIREASYHISQVLAYQRGSSLYGAAEILATYEMAKTLYENKDSSRSTDSIIDTIEEIFQADVEKMEDILYKIEHIYYRSYDPDRNDNGTGESEEFED